MGLCSQGFVQCTERKIEKGEERIGIYKGKN